MMTLCVIMATICGRAVALGFTMTSEAALGIVNEHNKGVLSLEDKWWFDVVKVAADVTEAERQFRRQENLWAG